MVPCLGCKASTALSYQEMDECSYRILLFTIVKQHFSPTDLFHVNRSVALDYIFKRHAHCDEFELTLLLVSERSHVTNSKAQPRHY